MLTGVAAYRVNHSEHLNGSLSSPKTATESENTGITNIKKQFFNQKNHEVQQTGIMPSYGGGTDKCARCSKTVYLAEKRAGAGRAFHLKCFSCQTCNRKLDASTLSEHKGEIYCKRCYTRQFGVHGLAQGVTMTTEQTTPESRPSRRSSYSSDLDAPVIAYHQTRQRAHSNDSTLRGEHSAIYTDEIQKMFPWKNDVLPDDHSESKHNKNLETDHTPMIDLHRKSSPIGFQHVIQASHIGNHARHSAISAQPDRAMYDVEDDQQTHANRLSALVQAPFIPPPQRTNSTVERIEIPCSPIRNDEKIRNPSLILTDTYRRENSREHSVNKSDNFSPSILNEIYYELHDQSVPNHSVNTNMVATRNPVLKHKYSHSNSYEGQQTTPVTQIVYRDQIHSDDLSPSVHGGVLRGSTSSSYALPPPYDYLSPQSSQANVTDRRPLSSGQNQQPKSAVNELVTRSSKIILSTAGENYSTISTLANSFRPISYANNLNNDGFDN